MQRHFIWCSLKVASYYSCYSLLWLPESPEVSPREIGCVCVPCFPKPLPYFDQNLRSSCPIYDLSTNSTLCLWRLWPKHNDWRAFIDGVIDNDEKVGSSMKTFSVRTRERTPYPIYNKFKIEKIDTLFRIKTGWDVIFARTIMTN